MYLLLLVLALQPPQDVEKEARATLLKGLDSLSQSVDELAQFIDTRFAADSDAPKTGMAVSSSDIGDDGLHAIIVVTVIADSPADRAGIRPGDRITDIGTRHIAHETAQVVRMLTDGVSGPLIVGIHRGQADLTVTVHRTPIACLQRASANAHLTGWQVRFTRMRDLIARTRAGLDEKGKSETERLNATHRRVTDLFAAFNEMSGMISAELTRSVAHECTFKASR